MDEAAARSDGLPRARLSRAIQSRLRPAAILLFGSHARDAVSELSDVDIAVLLGRPRPDIDDLARLRTDLEEIAGKSVDLVILDDASPILAMEVLRQHQMLGCADPQAWENFVVLTLTDYADLKRVRQPIEAALLRSRG